ncbi:MAG TPA: hypothetical protein VEJ84_17050, partial [Acidimicrobiales bacterium]|nr:hypothetical protein [Acidimicrobiales bacterium]
PRAHQSTVVSQWSAAHPVPCRRTWRAPQPTKSGEPGPRLGDIGFEEATCEDLEAESQRSRVPNYGH